MMTLLGSAHRFCDGVSRRNLLQIGALGVGGLSWPRLLQARENVASPRAVIMICLPGGPTHHDTYDMKPNAPEEIRGEFRPIQSNVPGLDLCEHLPLQAGIADKLAVVRNLTFRQPDHQLHEVYTGYPTLAGRPAFGSVVSRLRAQERSALPNYISLALTDHPRTVAKAEMPTYAGPAHAPLEPNAEFLANLRSLDASLLSDRRGLLRAFDSLRNDLEHRGELTGVEETTTRAFDLLTSSAVRQAFDLNQEPEPNRRRYGADRSSSFNYQFGHTWHGSRFLLARRLVEAGVPVVTLAEMGWDHHGNLNGVRGTIFERSREQLPWLDQSIHALVTDLHDRGLDKDVAVVVWGEFGRTPRINKYGGRDHWPSAGFALLAGGGFRTGQVIGATDARGERPRGTPYTPQHVLATLYHHLGIDTTTTINDFTGRPVHLLDQAEPIRELL